MYQAVAAESGRRRGLRVSSWIPRVLGVALLAFLLVRSDLGALSKTIQEANHLLVLASLGLVLPLILVKTVRWQGILRSQLLQLRLWPAYLAYFGSMFIGFLTPGRLGEFVKAAHVSRECGATYTQGFSSVLADRLLDLCLLLAIGSLALGAVASGPTEVLAISLVALVFILLLAFLLNDRAFLWIRFPAKLKTRRIQSAFSTLIFWTLEVRGELRKLSGRRLAIAAILTVVAYLIFFAQCYLLALALSLDVGFIQISYVVALGSLVTLLPISISGLGTREAVSIAYLGALGVPSEAALGFSLLVFLTFYVGGGLIGAVAWWLKPVPLGMPRLKARPDSLGG